MIAATLCTVIVLFVLPITPKVPVSTAVIQRGSLLRTQSVEGMIRFGNEQPCLSLLAGQVAELYVAQGQRVQKGEALLRLDTSAEERALKEMTGALKKQEELVSSLSYEKDAVQAVWLQNRLTMEQKVQELMASIDAKTLRAQNDGIIGQVYTAPDSYVAALTPLMSIHENTVEIYAQHRMQDSANLRTGVKAVVYANGQQQAIAELSGFGAPVLDSMTGLSMQTLRFSVREGAAWVQDHVGETVSMELLWDAQENLALAPMAAVSQDDLLWVVRDGKAVPMAIDSQKRDADYVCVPENLVGESVVLLPDETPLFSGCLIKEAKK